ncbi:MAG: glycerophosphodiester phosphodiesterase [Anaerolineae bacterium]|jgi:glycerophosphoryl diester phosphodiesterase|nr:glycerophosphodiester phosphodiesterase [Anaerolineae bacterium]MBT7072486.1 glycerophosphodiester phosphodiesterase [Anaerolineae bacterium]MBT7324151.1 glycerophosphodiester phosphodiesterase [Anaerolineae bacterium]
MFKNIPSPTIFAHRGASAHAPENTLAAFELAREQGADAIELDVKLSADGIPVVIHDSTVDRTTNGSGSVSNLSLASLQELDAGDGQRIPTLDEVFAAVGQDLYINVELTNYGSPNDALVEKVVEVIEKHALQERILFSSFFAKNLHRAAELLPDTPRGLLALPGLLGLWARIFGFRAKAYQAVHPSIKNVNAKMIARAHQRGKRVHVWTVNTADEMRQLVEWGVDGIFTDDPKLAVEILRGET